MLINWDKHKKCVDNWKVLFWQVYNTINGKKYRPLSTLHVKVKTAPSTWKEYKVETLSAENGLAGEYISVNLCDEQSPKELTINIYPAFELKSDSKIIREDILLKMVYDQLDENCFIKKEVISDTVYI